MAFFAFIISILSLLVSLSRIQTTLFEERYAIYSTAKKFISKLNAKDYVQLATNITESDLNLTDEIIDKSNFLFGGDEDIESELEFIHNSLEFFYSRWDLEQNQLIDQNSMMECSRHFKSMMLTLNEKIENKTLEKVFNYHLKISYLSFEIPIQIYKNIVKTIKEKFQKDKGPSTE